MDSDTCYGTPKFAIDAIDDTGVVLVRDTLYTHLYDGGPIKFSGQQSLCDYKISVTDTSADTIQEDQVEAKVGSFYFTCKKHPT